jgi:hypothetical protein
VQPTIRYSVIRAIFWISLFCSPLPQGEAQSSTTRTLVAMRNGHEIGTETISVTRSEVGATAKIGTHLQVKLLGVTVYRFEQASTEVWSKDRLDELTSETSDNGKAHNVHVHRDGSGLKVDADHSSSLVDSAALPATLWHELQFRDATLVHATDGQIVHVKAQKLADKKIEAGKDIVVAGHYRVDGDLPEELSFGSDGILVQRRTLLKDHSVLELMTR